MRPRKLDVHHATRSKLSRLKKEAEQDGAYRVAKRIHAVLLSAEHEYTSGEIACLLKAPRSKVSLWLRRYEEDGFDALLEGHRSGRPSGLSSEQETQLADIVDSGPVAYGFLGGVWTSPMIARVISEEFSREYHPGHVRKILYRLGFSVQQPKHQLAKADPDLLGRWRRYKYPRIKKKPGRKTPFSFLKTKPASGRIQRSIKHGPGKDVSRLSR